jgi:hypothetical protein
MAVSSNQGVNAPGMSFQMGKQKTPQGPSTPTIPQTGGGVGVAGTGTQGSSIPARGGNFLLTGGTSVPVDPQLAKQVDDYWDLKYQAADKAAEEINAQIAEEASQASLFGSDYLI